MQAGALKLGKDHRQTLGGVCGAQVQARALLGVSTLMKEGFRGIKREEGF